MVSRSETARPLLTPGEVMQLPPADEIVMIAGTPPIRAKKARYFEDRRFQERILPPPALAKTAAATPDDWSKMPMPPRPEIGGAAARDGKGHDADPHDRKEVGLGMGRQVEGSLGEGGAEKKK